MTKSKGTIQLARTVHLYLGLIFAPSIIFFGFTGGVQLFNWHEASKDGTYVPPAWVEVLAQVHIHQSTSLRKSPPKAVPRELSPVAPLTTTEATSETSAESKPEALAESKSEAAPEPKPQAETEPEKQPSNRPAKKNNLFVKCYFLLLAIGLIVTTIIGVYMSFAYLRDKRLIFGMLAIGTVLPVVLLLV